MTESQHQVLAAVRQAVAEARSSGQLAEFLGALETVRVEALIAPASPEDLNPTPNSKDRLLTADEAAQKIRMSVWWIYANKDALPIVRLPTGRYRFSEKGLEKWLQRRRAS